MAKMTQGETNMSTSYDLEDAVILLHNVARTIEREWGFSGSLALADRLSEVLHTEVPSNKVL
jgi:hypothetical protein